jgi:predicted nucleic acid-binding protein
MCKTVISAAKAAKCEIVTSALSFVEVCKSPEVRAEGEDKIAAFFEHEFIIVANLDRYVGERGRELMLMGQAGLKPPDASHVATAAISNANEMHTFDKKLLDLDHTNCSHTPARWAATSCSKARLKAMWSA